MWLQAAAALAPYVIGAFSKKPKRPQAPLPTGLPDRGVYDNILLNNAFNDNAPIFKLASEAAGEEVNRMLARNGMQGSSVGAQVLSNSQAELANKYVTDMVTRQAQVLNATNTNDVNRGRFSADQVNAQYNAQLAGYNDDIARRTQAIQGIAGLFQTGANLYGQYDAEQMQLKSQEDLKAQMASYAANQAPMYGVPGGGGYGGYQGPLQGILNK